VFQGDKVPSYSGSKCPTSWNTWIFRVVSCFQTHWSLSVNTATEEPLQWLSITERLEVPLTTQLYKFSHIFINTRPQYRIQIQISVCGYKQL